MLNVFKQLQCLFLVNKKLFILLYKDNFCWFEKTCISKLFSFLPLLIFPSSSSLFTVLLSLVSRLQSERSPTDFLLPGHTVSVSQLSVLAVAPTPHLRLQGGKRLLGLGDHPSQRGEGDCAHPRTAGFPQQPWRHCGHTDKKKNPSLTSVQDTD